MPVVKYLGTEIQVAPGTRSSGEVAWIKVEDAAGRPVPTCFLGGEAEAKRWVRERKMGPRTGPRPAIWFIELDNGSTSCRVTRASAMGEHHYWVREGRAHKVVRRELCRVPGCDGHGTISERGRSGRYVDRPCPIHEEPAEELEVEWLPSPDSVLPEACGFGLDGGPCYACELRAERVALDTPGA